MNTTTNIIVVVILVLLVGFGVWYFTSTKTPPASEENSTFNLNIETGMEPAPQTGPAPQ